MNEVQLGELSLWDKKWLNSILREELLPPTKAIKSRKAKSDVSYGKSYAYFKQYFSHTCPDKPLKPKHLKEIFDYLWNNGIRDFSDTDKITQSFDITYDDLKLDELLQAFRLATKTEPDIDAQKYEEEWRKTIEEQLELHDELDEKFQQFLNENPQMVKEKLEKISRAKATRIDELACDLDKTILIGKNVWKILLYAVLSINAPRIRVGSMNTRSTMHTLLVGEPSTAKTLISDALTKMSAHSMVIDEFTKASFIGVATRDKIEEGIIDKANKHLLCIRELDAINMDLAVLNTILECNTYAFEKAGIRKEIEINIGWLVGLNPRKSFFKEQKKMIEQLNYAESFLSRFDVIIPFVSNKEKSAQIVRAMLFGRPIAYDGIKDVFATLSAGMSQLEGIKISETQMENLYKTYENRNEDLEYRTLLLPRDAEMLIRLLNVISCSKFSERKIEDNKVIVQDEDVEEAIELFDDIIHMRKQLYHPRRTITSVEDFILAEIRKGTTDLNLLKRAVISENICSQSTFYRKISQLKDKGLLK